MKQLYSQKNKGLVILCILILAITTFLTACSQNDIGDGGQQIQNVDLPPSINVTYGTTKEQVIENYLSDQTEITFTNGQKEKVNLSWTAPEGYDGTPKEEKNEGYQFTASFKVNNSTNTHPVEIIVLDKVSREYSTTMNLTADQEKKIFNREGTILLNQDQYTEIEDQLTLLYNNLAADIDKEVIGKIIDQKVVEMDKLTDIAQDIYQSGDLKIANTVSEEMNLEKISEVNKKSKLQDLKSTDNTYIFTPVNASDDYNDYSSEYTSINQYLPGFTKSETEANRYTGYLGTGNQSLGAGAINSTALQQITFPVKEDNTDLTIKAKIYYDYGTVGIGASMGGTAELKQLSSEKISYQWTENPLNFEYLADRASFVLSFVVPGKDPLNIYQTLDDIGKVLDYQAVSNAFEQLENTRQKTITYQKESLDSGIYKFSVGLGARTSAIALGTSKAVAQGVVEKITVELSKNKPPSKPELKFPNYGATNLDNDLVLDWTESTDPEGDKITYNVILGTNQTTGDIIATNLEKTSYEVSNLDHNTTYYWKIIAKDEAGNKTVSEQFKFTTKKEIPEHLELPAKIIYPNDRFHDGERVIGLDLNQFEEGVQQYIKVAINQTIKVKYRGYCRDLPGGAPAPIVQHFLSYSWEDWPPSDYQPLYNTVPPDSGEYYEKTFYIKAPMRPGIYELWVCGGHMYSMEDTVNNHTEQPNLRPHGVIEVIK